MTVCLGLNDAAFLPSQLDLVRPVVVAPCLPALGTGPRFGVVRRMVHERATELGLTSTDIMTTTINDDENRLCADGIHPDDAGHAAIARAMIGYYEGFVPALCRA